MNYSLYDLRNAQREIQILRQRIDEMKNRIESIKSLDYTKVKVQGGSRTELAELLDALVVLMQKYKQRMQALTLVTSRFYSVLEKMTDPLYRQVLEYRYIDCLRVLFIADAVQYSKSQTYLILKKAEREFYKIYNANLYTKKKSDKSDKSS